MDNIVVDNTSLDGSLSPGFHAETTKTIRADGTVRIYLCFALFSQVSEVIASDDDNVIAFFFGKRVATVFAPSFFRV